MNLLFIASIALALVVASSRGSQGELVLRIKPSVTYQLQKNPIGQRLRNLGISVRQMLLPRALKVSLEELYELADYVLLIERQLAAGDSIVGAISWVAARGESALGKQFAWVAAQVAAGASLVGTLKKWQAKERRGPHQDVLAKLLSSLTTGSDTVATMEVIAESLEAQIKARQLANLSKSETRMLIPLVFLVLPITVLFAIFPSLSLLNINLE